MRIALFGFGTVGSSVARILLESKPEGLELTHIYNRNIARKKVDWIPKSVVWSEDWESVLASDVDVVVEIPFRLRCRWHDNKRVLEPN